MLTNRSIPRSTVIPELGYADVNAAAEWLVRAFGFTVRLRIASHRIQMNIGDGAMVITELPGDRTPSAALSADRDSGSGFRAESSKATAYSADLAHGVMVRVADVNAHHQRAVKAGARILRPPEDYPYGERQYAAEDCGGHRWKFSQSIADVAPATWGGTSEDLN
jgi:uncharacterized glyoxalase superfamily protein PhnB